MYVFCVTLSVGHVSLPMLMLHVRLCCNKNNSDKRVNGHLNLFSTFRYAWVYFRSKQRKQYIKLYGEKNADTWVAKVSTDLVNYTIDFDPCHSSGNNARKSSHAFIFFQEVKAFLLYQLSLSTNVPPLAFKQKKSLSAYDVEEIESHQEGYFAFLFKILLKTWSIPRFGLPTLRRFTVEGKLGCWDLCCKVFCLLWCDK